MWLTTPWLILVRMTTGCAHTCHVTLTTVWPLTSIDRVNAKFSGYIFYASRKSKFYLFSVIWDSTWHSRYIYNLECYRLTWGIWSDVSSTVFIGDHYVSHKICPQPFAKLFGALTIDSVHMYTCSIYMWQTECMRCICCVVVPVGLNIPSPFSKQYQRHLFFFSITSQHCT